MHKKIARIIGLFLGMFGILVIILTLSPIIGYKFYSRDKFPDLLNPLVESDLGEADRRVDYTKASNWFVGSAPAVSTASSKVNYYTISVPQLKIKNAVVEVGGEDLSKNLIQYPGTALPGRVGNTVIFGHSVLPIFFDPEDYISIFSTLHTIKKGSDVEVNYDGIVYLYRVEQIIEVKPTGIYVLDQDKDDAYLSLITCTPPGDPRKPKRLVVKAKLVPFVD